MAIEHVANAAFKDPDVFINLLQKLTAQKVGVLSVADIWFLDCLLGFCRTWSVGHRTLSIGRRTSCMAIEHVANSMFYCNRTCSMAGYSVFEIPNSRRRTNNYICKAKNRRPSSGPNLQAKLRPSNMWSFNVVEKDWTTLSFDEIIVQKTMCSRGHAWGQTHDDRMTSCDLGESSCRLFRPEGGSLHHTFILFLALVMNVI